jgi:ADP-glucose pyrophosphorylase
MRRSWASPEARLAGDARLARAVVEAGATVGRGARLTRSLVLPGASVGAGAELEETIVGFGAALPARARIARQVVVVARKGVPAGEGDSRLEGHLYSHLDRVRRRENPGL